MPKAFPKEFRDDVAAVARKAEASVAQVAKDFGITECDAATVHRATPTLCAPASPR